MALLRRVPSLQGTHTDAATLGSSRAAPSKPFQLRPPRVCGSGHRLIVASIKEIYKRPNRKQEPSDGSRKKHIPPWRTSWTPIRRKSSLRAPTRDWSNHQHYPRQRSGRHALEDEEMEEEQHRSSEDMHAPHRTAMTRIIQKLRDLEKAIQPADDPRQDKSLPDRQNAGVEHVHTPLHTLPLTTAGELFLPRPNQDVFSVGNYWSTPDHPVPAPGRGLPDTKFSWEFEEGSKDKEEERKKRVSTPTLAELIIPPKQLKRLRTAGIALENPINIGRLGITDNIADKIIGQWRKSELVKIRCGGPAATNMMRIHKDLERKTGGLVIWRSGGVAVVYRGDDYDMINKAATSLKDKLDGLLASQKTPERFSKNLNLIHMNKDLPGVVHSGGTQSLGDIQVAILAQSNKLQHCSKTDTKQSEKPAIGIIGDTKQSEKREIGIIGDTKQSEKPAIGILQGVLPISCPVDQSREQNAVMQVDLPHLQPLDSQSDDLQIRLEATHAVQSDLLETQSSIVCTQRPNMYPDPFVDRDYELEVDSLLETLGPRCQDWTGPTPVPVDADLLPPLVPNYKPPYRLLPYGVRPQLTNIEQTNLRRLIRHIAPHFVLGRNEGHQGLAAAILKIWEKSEVVKIAVKAGVQNSSNYKMAEELKRWTGGVLLSRDRFIITIYRGKDFLPRSIACAITERTAMLRKLKADDEFIEDGISTIRYPNTDVPSAEEVRYKAEHEFLKKAEAEKAKRIILVKDLEEKLVVAMDKKHKAELDLELIETSSEPMDEPVDSEPLTEEEKYMFRRVGLKMKQFLLIGRRGVFDGVVENMHLHWKHRELVKLVVKEGDPVQLQKIAKLLELESGGVLVAAESIPKGQAIVVYRGKNYQRPRNLRPQALFNKRKALERSLEKQRHASLTSRIAVLEKEIAKLKSSLSVSELRKDALLDVALDELSNASSDMKEKAILKSNQLGIDNTSEVTGEQSEEGKLSASVCSSKKDLLNMTNLGPIYRATRLSNLERLKLRKVALKLGVGSRFHVGKSNAMVGLCRAIRVHFLKHSLVVIGIKHRGQGTSPQDLVHELEDLTGGVFVSKEENQIILYRGWPKGEKMPISGSVKQVSPELLAAVEAEEEEDDADVSLLIMPMLSCASDDDDVSEAEDDEVEFLFQ